MGSALDRNWSLTIVEAVEGGRASDRGGGSLNASLAENDAVARALRLHDGLGAVHLLVERGWDRPGARRAVRLALSEKLSVR